MTVTIYMYLYVLYVFFTANQTYFFPILSLSLSFSFYLHPCLHVLLFIILLCCLFFGSKTIPLSYSHLMHYALCLGPLCPGSLFCSELALKFLLFTPIYLFFTINKNTFWLQRFHFHLIQTLFLSSPFTTNWMWKSHTSLCPSSGTHRIYTVIHPAFTPLLMSLHLHPAIGNRFKDWARNLPPVFPQMNLPSWGYNWFLAMTADSTSPHDHTDLQLWANGYWVILLSVLKHYWPFYKFCITLSTISVIVKCKPAVYLSLLFFS